MDEMKLSGFTFVRNAVRLDYPVVESISSILPIVDEFIVNVGPDEDGTLDLIRSIEDPKIKIIQSQWNPNLTTGYYVCSQQANIALFNCMGKWAFCLHPDEVIHEEDLPLIMAYINRYEKDDRVEGLALREMNFWGDYKTIINVYPERQRRKCKIVKPHCFVLSRGDAAGFTVHPKYKERGRRIRIVDTKARLFHYSVVKSEEGFKNKLQIFANYSGKNKNNYGWRDNFLYRKLPKQFLAPYQGNHPKVMSERIRNHSISIDLSSVAEWRSTLTWRERWRFLKTLFVTYITDRFSGRGSYKLLKR